MWYYQAEMLIAITKRKCQFLVVVETVFLRDFLLERRVLQMKGEKLLVTMADIKRYEVLKDVIEKKFKSAEAAQLLNLSTVHTSLKEVFAHRWFWGIIEEIFNYAAAQ
jgi:hypothetical protein